MTKPWPTKTSLSVHNLADLQADAAPDNGGAVTLIGWNSKDYETCDITIFTGDAKLSAELAEAINETLRNHGRHHGDNEKAAREFNAPAYAAEVAADTRREEMAA